MWRSMLRQVFLTLRAAAVILQNGGLLMRRINLFERVMAQTPGLHETLGVFSTTVAPPVASAESRAEAQDRCNHRAPETHKDLRKEYHNQHGKFKACPMCNARWAHCEIRGWIRYGEKGVRCHGRSERSSVSRVRSQGSSSQGSRPCPKQQIRSSFRDAASSSADQTIHLPNHDPSMAEDMMSVQHLSSDDEEALNSDHWLQIDAILRESSP